MLWSNAKKNYNVITDKIKKNKILAVSAPGAY